MENCCDSLAALQHVILVALDRFHHSEDHSLSSLCLEEFELFISSNLSNTLRRFFNILHLFSSPQNHRDSLSEHLIYRLSCVLLDVDLHTLSTVLNLLLPPIIELDYLSIVPSLLM